MEQTKSSPKRLGKRNAVMGNRTMNERLGGREQIDKKIKKHR